MPPGSQKQTGKNYRLPSEAEWEYAARAGTSSARFWGDNPDDACTFANVADKTFQQKFPNWQVHNCTDGYVYTAPVGKFAENKFKLQHTLGNVWEWTEDCWHENYDGAPNDGSAWVEDGDCSRRVIRGGSWNNKPRNVRSANRNRNNTDNRNNNVGFRLAQSACVAQCRARSRFVQGQTGSGTQVSMSPFPGFPGKGTTNSEIMTTSSEISRCIRRRSRC